jgi:hypothetical protein
MKSCEIGRPNLRRVRALILCGALLTVAPFLMDLGSPLPLLLFVSVAAVFLALAVRVCPMCVGVGEALRPKRVRRSAST